MDQSKMDQSSSIGCREWCALAQRHFPELPQEEDSEEVDDGRAVCEDLAYLANEAHGVAEGEGFLKRCYEFIRWSIRNPLDDQLRGWISDDFFDSLLTDSNSKKGCLDYLDWGDVRTMLEGFTVEPHFTDIHNFEKLCGEWRKRWSRNQKLEPPRNHR